MRDGLYERVLELSAPERSVFLRSALRDEVSRAHLTPSSAQRRMWFHAQWEPDRAIYHVPAAYRLAGRLDPRVLGAALDLVVGRHESLRSRFVAVEGEPVVLVSSSVPGLAVRDLRSVPPGERDAAATALLSREIVRPFDLAAGPLVRYLLVRLADDDQILLVNAHHIVIDGLSWAIVSRELQVAYRALRAGRDPDLPAPALQYQDFADWQRRLLGTGSYRRQLARRRAVLASAPPALDLPTDRPRPSGGSLRAGSVSERLTPAAVAGLTAAARHRGGTPSMAFLAGWVATLARYTGTADIPVGLAHAGRGRPEFAEVVGMFVNTLVVRAQLPEDPSFADVLGRVRAAALDAYSHADVPFESLVEELPQARVGDRNPLFQAFFSYHPAEEDLFELGGTVGVPIEFAAPWTAFDVDLAVQARADGSADLTLVHATDLFGERTARRMLADVRLVLEHAGTGTPLADLPPAGPPPPPPPPAVPPSVDCLHEVLDASFRRYPDRVAVVHGDERLTYRELDVAANRLAHHLRAHGVGPGTMVGVCVGRDPRLLVSIYAILRAGGAYVPLEAGLPAQRLRFLLRDSAAPVVVTEDRHRARLAEYTGTVVSLDGEAATIAARPATAPARTAGPGDLAYVMYTSGSTGEPKGVLVEHRSVVRLMDYYRTRLGAQDVAGVLASTPAGFDASLLEYFATPLFGGTIVLVDSVFDLHLLPERERVTLVQGVPSIVDELLRAGTLPPSVRTVVLSGEALPDELVTRIFAGSAVRRIYNIYGVTEYTADATWKLLEPGRTGPGLGEPLPGLRPYVLDERRRPVPPGARGELYLAGPGLARGYLNRPELTRERFVGNPFTTDRRALMYRTGDVVRYRCDDELEYVGRVDNQVKIHGCRVEPGEVEAVLRGHPGVSRAAVVARRTPAGDLALAAYAVPATAGVHADELRQHLARRLPAYMVPAVVTLLETLPLNANGKLDPAALPEPDASPPARRGTAARTPAERRLAALWCAVLDRTEIGVHDDFFQAGGHSLRALRLIARIRQEYGVSIAVGDLFQAPTVAEIAALLESGPVAGAASWVTLRGGGDRTPIVLVPGVGGSALPYAELARALPDGHPVHGFEAPGLEEGGVPLSGISELAACYLDRLHRAGPVGPVLLGGWSMGGAVAYELARRAVAAGWPVAGLLLLDTSWSPVDPVTGPADLVSLYSEYLLASARAPGGDATPLPAAVAADPDGPGPVPSLSRWSREHGLFGDEITDAQLARLVEVFAAHLRALDGYLPAPLDVPVLHLAAEASTGEDRAGPLRDVLGAALTVQTVPGDHYTILRTRHVGPTADRIAAWLAGLA